MDPQTRRLSVRLPAARVPAGIVCTAVAASGTAHAVAAATGPPGAMAWWMAAMTAICLACAAPMAVGRRCAGRAAGHLLTMSAAMILIHLVLLTAPGAGTHHGPAKGAAAAAFATHDGAMLALMGVELLCLMAASAALRLSRGKTTANPVPRPVPLNNPDTVLTTKRNHLRSLK
jgi:hypothetical protein